MTWWTLAAIRTNALLLLACCVPALAASGPVNVTSRLCGAVGDGVADDTAALQACIDYAKTHRLSVYLPGGAYRVTKSLNLTVSDGLFIRGDGQDSFGPGGTRIIDALTEAYPVLDFSGCQQCGVERLTVTPVPGTLSTVGILVSPGPARPVDGGFDFILRDAGANSSGCPTCAGVAIVGSDWAEIQNYLGGPIVMGYSLGRSTAVKSKFYDLSKVLPDGNPTMCRIDHAQFGGEYVPGLQLTGCQHYVIDDIDVGLNATGAAGTMVEVTDRGPNGVAENVIDARGLRTENFSTATGVNALTFSGRSTGGRISGNLCTDGMGRVLRVNDGVYLAGYDTISDYCEAAPFFSIGKNTHIWNDTFRIGQGQTSLGDIDPSAQWVDSSVRVPAWERFDVQRAPSLFPANATGSFGSVKLGSQP